MRLPITVDAETMKDIIAKNKAMAAPDSVYAQTVSKQKRKPHKQWSDDEHKGQAIFFADLKPKLVEKYPDVSNIMGLPLFQTGRAGFAGMNSGKRANAEGRRKGTWDILYPASRGGFLSLWIEAKILPNGLSDEQKQFAIDMVALGHCCIAAIGSDPESLAADIARIVELYETHHFQRSEK